MLRLRNTLSLATTLAGLSLAGLSTLGCTGTGNSGVESRAAAYTYNSYPAHFVVPAYFNDDAWSDFFDALDDGRDHSGSIVIVTGGNSGPDVPINNTLKNRIWSLRQRGISTLGYVNFGTQHVYDLIGKTGVPPTPSTVAAQTRTWIQSYVTNGVFLDLAWRQDDDLTDQSLADAEGVAYVARNTVGPDGQDTIAMFNWSVPYPDMQRYVDCLTTYLSATPGGSLFVSQETSESLYANEDSTWTWIHDYKPMNFVNIVNSIGGATDLETLLTKARSRNAAYYFLTNQDTNHYQLLPNYGTLQFNLEQDNVYWDDFNGLDYDNPDPYSWCPTPTSL